MRRLGALAIALALGGCSTVVAEAESEALCPPGQEHLRTAQLFFGRNVSAKPGVSQADFQSFVDQEITPRFPDGLTVMEGGGKWRGSENQLIREASKVVLIVLPKKRDTSQRIEAVRAAYKTRFNEESVLLVTQAACVSF